MKHQIGDAIFVMEEGLDYKVNAAVPLQLTINDPLRAAEFKTMIDRALNTWETAPKWLLELADALDKKPR